MVYKFDITANIFNILTFLLSDTTVTYSFGSDSLSTYTFIKHKQESAYFNDPSFISSYYTDTLTTVYCASLCDSAQNCGGFNFCDISGNKSCDLSASSEEPIHTGLIGWSPGCFYFHKIESQCKNGGILREDSSCWCPLGHVGQFCEQNPKDCVDGYFQGFNRNQVFFIQPSSNNSEFKASCRLQEGPVTRIMSRHFNFTDYFENKMWDHYRKGFYYPWKENSWIGLENLYNILTNSLYNHTARVTVYFQNDTTPYTGYYENFSIKDELNDYSLTYSSFHTGEHPLVDGFSGTGNNDSVNGQPFCTPNKDCGGCANNSNSGWWFNTGCAYVVPTAPLHQLVWPYGSELVPVDELTVDIMADI